MFEYQLPRMVKLMENC